MVGLSAMTLCKEHSNVFKQTVYSCFLWLPQSQMGGWRSSVVGEYGLYLYHVHYSTFPVSFMQSLEVAHLQWRPGRARELGCIDKPQTPCALHPKIIAALYHEQPCRFHR